MQAHPDVPLRENFEELGRLRGLVFIVLSSFAEEANPVSAAEEDALDLQVLERKRLHLLIADLCLTLVTHHCHSNLAVVALEVELR